MCDVSTILIDRIQICQLPSRYGIARSALYTRMKDLGIKPQKEGKQAYINIEEMHQLDALHEHLKAGRTTAEFLSRTSSLSPGHIDSANEIEFSQNLVQLIGKTLEHNQIQLLISGISRLLLAKAQYFEADVNPFKSHLLLSQAASSGCILTSSQLIAILEIKKIPRLKEGKFARKGFLFSRIRNSPDSEIPLTSGREAEWRVSRQIYN